MDPSVALGPAGLFASAPDANLLGFAEPDSASKLPALRDKDGKDQIEAIAAYLWQDGFDGNFPEQQRR